MLKTIDVVYCTALELWYWILLEECAVIQLADLSLEVTVYLAWLLILMGRTLIVTVCVRHSCEWLCNR